MNSQQLAARLKIQTRSVTRIAAEHKIGKKDDSGRWQFTAEHAKRIGKIAHSGPGNPAMQNRIIAKKLGAKGGRK